MDSYYDHLAVQVLNEKLIVTYRSVSRALKVHVNLAKQMLWDFHHRENAKKSGSVHATYLLVGQRRSSTVPSAKSSQRYTVDDMAMDSSPPLPGSSMAISESEPEVQTSVIQKAIILVRQEDLEEAKSSFTNLTSMHIYSLVADGLDDFQLLANCNRKILSTLRTDDLLQTGKQYGLIQNPAVKRRTRKTPLPPATVAKVEVLPPKAANQPSEANKPPAAAKPASKASLPAKPALLKQSSSGIAASFAKGAGKPKSMPKPSPAPAVEPSDTAMGGMSDDDDDDAGDDDPVVELDVKAPGGKTKKDRQAELEAMMDVDDEVVDEPAEEPSAPVDEPEPPKPEPAESIVVENGRRRGRRKVMKKKVVRDEEGYLITKEEPIWESFSEDEPEPKKSKTTSAPMPAAKKAGKPGQGNIMSFFGKK